MTKTTATISVRVASAVRQYPRDIAGLGDHLAAGGSVVSLAAAKSEARALFRSDEKGVWRSAQYWVELDDSGLAYLVEVKRTGRYGIVAASPTREIRDMYDANGYDA